MTEQSTLAKLGLRTGTLGTSSTLAIAAPVTEGDISPTASTVASRIGFFFDRTAASERIGLVVMGTVTARFQQTIVYVDTAAEVSGQLRIADGTVSLPGFGFISDVDTGIYSIGANTLGIATAGALIVTASANSLTVGNNTKSSTTNLEINTAAGVERDINFLTAGVSRIVIRCSNTAEAGSNSGSNLQIIMRDDAGAAVESSILHIRRAAGEPLLLCEAGGRPIVLGTTAAIGTERCLISGGGALPAVSTTQVAISAGGIVTGAGINIGGLGTVTGAIATTTLIPALQLNSTVANGSAIILSRWNNSQGPTPNIVLAKSRGAAVNTFSAVADLDSLAKITADGDDGTSFVMSSYIEFLVDGTVGTGFVPGAISFRVAPAGSGTPLEAFRISADKTLLVPGNITLGGIITASKSNGGAYSSTWTNTSSAASAQSILKVINDASVDLSLTSFSSTNSTVTFGVTASNYLRVASTSSSAAGLLIGLTAANAPIIFGSNNAEVGRFSSGTVGTGQFALLYTTDASSTTTGSFTTLGGMSYGATKTLYGGLANFAGLVITVASATGGAGFRLPHGTAPTSPVNGDIWTTTAGLFARINGSTVGPYGTGGGSTPGGADTQVQFNDGGAFAGNASFIFNKTSLQLELGLGTTLLPSYTFVGDPNTGWMSQGADQLSAIAGGLAVLTISTGAISTSVQIWAGSGTAALPSYSFNADSDTGMYLSNTNEIGFATNGTFTFSIRTDAINAAVPYWAIAGSVTLPSITFGPDPDTGFYSIAANDLGVTTGGVLRLDISTALITASLPVTITPPALTGTPNRALTVNAAAHTALTAATEYSSIAYIGAIQQFATGSLAMNRAVVINAPTYAFVGASTLTTAATFAIAAAPIVGTNATITNAYALWVQAGISQFDGAMQTSSTFTGAVSSNGIYTLAWSNASAGTAALSRIRVTNDASNSLGVNVWGSGFTGTVFGITAANYAGLTGIGSTQAGLLIGFTASNAPIIFGTNNLEVGRFSSGTLATGQFALLYTTDASSTTTGSFTTLGGMSYGTTKTLYGGLANFSGAVTFAGVINAADGTAALPSYTYTADPNTGIYRVGADSIGQSTNGVLRLTVDTAAITSTLPFVGPLGAVGTPTYTFVGDLDTGMYSNGANSVEIGTGGARRIQFNSADVTTYVPIAAVAGTVALPTYSFSSDTATGLYYISTSTFGISTAGTLRVTFDTAAVTSTLPFVAPLGAVGTPSYTFTGDLDTGVYSEAANTVSISAGGTLRLSIGTAGISTTGTGIIGSTLIVGAATLDGDIAAFFGTVQLATVYSASAGTGNMQIAVGANAFANSFAGVKTRSAGTDANTIVVNGDKLASFAGFGADGATYRSGGSLEFFVDGTPGTAIMPTGLILRLSPTGSATRATVWTVSNGGGLTMNPTAQTGAPTRVLTVNAAAHTALTASTEYISTTIVGVTQEFATGALTTNRFVTVSAPTYAFVGASTLTTAATFAITAAPIAGANATITNSYALWVQAGTSNFAGLVQTVASATGTAGLNVPHGAAPTSPVNGDIWTTTAGLFARINGATVGYGAGTVTGSGSSTQLAYWSGASALTGSANLTYNGTTQLALTPTLSNSTVQALVMNLSSTGVGTAADITVGNSTSVSAGIAVYGTSKTGTLVGIALANSATIGLRNSSGGGQSLFIGAVDGSTGNTVYFLTDSTLIATFTSTLWTTSVAFTVNGDVTLGTAGNGLYIKEGSNATSGVATLSSGTVVVSTTKVTANSRIQLTPQALGTITVPVGLAVSARTAGTSFTILSGNLADTSVVAWVIIEPAA